MEATGKEKLVEIVNRKEYQVYYEDNRSLIQKAIDWIQELFEKFLQKLFPNLTTAANVAGIIIAILFIMLVVILAIIVVRLINRHRLRRAYEQSIPFSHLHEGKWTYHDHFQAAKEQEGNGLYAEGIRHLFLGLILYYHHMGWLTLERWKTNWEYYSELKRRVKEEASHFNKLALQFDEVTYGKKKVSKEQFEQFKANVEQAYHEAEQKR